MRERGEELVLWSEREYDAGPQGGIDIGVKMLRRRVRETVVIGRGNA